VLKGERSQEATPSLVNGTVKHSASSSEDEGRPRPTPRREFLIPSFMALKDLDLVHQESAPLFADGGDVSHLAL
jgi:hypothetical protein